MRFVVDAPNGMTWFRLETETEAALETQLMRHAVEKYFRIEREKAIQSYQPASKTFIEQDIGLNKHIQREMPLFLTLRDQDGKAHVTAMLPPGGSIAVTCAWPFWSRKVTNIGISRWICALRPMSCSMKLFDTG